MRVAVTGAAGQLGGALCRALAAYGVEVIQLVRPAFSLEHPRLPPAVDLVINAAAWTNVDGCARDPDRAMLVNGQAPGILARAARESGAGFVQISTNEVFDGAERRTYAESDVPRPINPYGASKLSGERSATAEHPSATIVRTAWIYGGPRSFPLRIVEAARLRAERGESLAVVDDEFGNPTPANLLADRVVALVTEVRAAPSIIHLAGTPPTSRHAWAVRLLAAEGLPPPAPMALGDFVRDSTPPPHAVLDTSLAESLGLGITWE